MAVSSAWPGGLRTSAVAVSSAWPDAMHTSVVVLSSAWLAGLCTSAATVCNAWPANLKGIKGAIYSHPAKPHGKILLLFQFMYCIVLVLLMFICILAANSWL
jgi:hypothetical protein